MLEPKFPQGVFRSMVPGFGEQPLATHNPEVLGQRLQFRVLLRNCRYHVFERNRDGFYLIPCPCFWHFSFYAQPLTQLRNSSLPGFSSANCYRVPASPLPVTQNCGVPTIQLLATWKKQPHHSFSQQCLCLRKKNAEEKEGTLKYPSSLFFPLSPFTLTETVYQPFSLNRYNSVVTAVVIRISTSEPLGLSGVTVT